MIFSASTRRCVVGSECENDPPPEDDDDDNDGSEEDENTNNSNRNHGHPMKCERGMHNYQSKCFKVFLTRSRSFKS